jgi:hypothetical protein
MILDEEKKRLTRLGFRRGSSFYSNKIINTVKESCGKGKAEIHDICGLPFMMDSLHTESKPL